MGAIAFGETELVYSVRLSPKARKKRIEITPCSITIIAPGSASEEDVVAFMRKKAKAVFIAQEKLKARNRSYFQEKDQFFSGGKVTFRGRRLAVRVAQGDVEQPGLSYKSRFFITLPKSVEEDEKEAAVARVMDKWLRARLLQDSVEIAEELGKKRGLAFKAVRVRGQKHIWATCGKDGTLYINHLLIKVPRKVLEYVVAHELAHLRHRNHSETFWALVGQMVPEHKVLQAMLDTL